MQRKNIPSAPAAGPRSRTRRASPRRAVVTCRFSAHQPLQAAFGRWRKMFQSWTHGPPTLALL